MTDASFRYPTDDPAANAARVAEIGYTAIVDRCTTSIQYQQVVHNVHRSVTSGGGSLAESFVYASAFMPICSGGVSTFTAGNEDGCFATLHKPTAFAIDASSQGKRAVVAATCVLGDPSADTRAQASRLASAMREVLQSLQVDATIADIYEQFDEYFSPYPDSSAHCLVLPLESIHESGVSHDGIESTLVEGRLYAVLTKARAKDGPIAFGTSVRISSTGAERLENVPLRLIELR